MSIKTETEDILEALMELSSETVKAKQKHFAIGAVNNLGLTQPQIKAVAKSIGKNHALALELWKTGIHEAKHVAVLLADKKQITEKQMESWLKDLNSWDIVDGTVGQLFDKTPFAWDKAIAWTYKSKEFEKRAGFAMMAMLALHDKKADDARFEAFFPHLFRESDDNRNFVKKAVNWALRQIGKRNERLCKKAIQLAKEIQKKGDTASRWIAADALRELERYLAEGKIGDKGRGTSDV